MNILIVDDKPNLIRVTAVALRTLGCETLGAGTIAAATQLLATQKVDAVLLDVNLGGENGLEFLSQLTSQPASPPVVIFSSHTKDEIAAVALSHGAFDCLLKPFTLDDLRQLIEKITQHRLTSGRLA